MATAKETLDLRLASGDISEAEYDRLLGRIATSATISTGASTQPEVDPKILESMPKETLLAGMALYNNLPENITSLVSKESYLLAWHQQQVTAAALYNSGENRAIFIGFAVCIAIMLAGRSAEASVIAFTAFFVVFYIAKKIIVNGIKVKITADFSRQMASMISAKSSATTAH